MGARWIAGVVGVLLAVSGCSLLRSEDSPCCVDPDLDQDVHEGVFGPPGAAIRARLEVVEVAALEDRLRTTVHFTNEDDEPASFGTDYFTGGEGSASGIRVLDTDHQLYYGPDPDLGSRPEEEFVWEPDVTHEIVVDAPRLRREPGTVTVLAPDGTALYRDVAVVDGGGSSRRAGGADPVTFPVADGVPEPADPLPLVWREKADAPEPEGEVGASTEREWAEGGRVWRLSIDSVHRDGAIGFVRYTLTLVSGRPPAGEDPEDLPADLDLTVVDSDLLMPRPEQRVDTEDGALSLGRISWAVFDRAGQEIEGSLLVMSHRREEARVDVHAGPFGVIEHQDVLGH
ncbi:hypothetical protein [Nocardiopsis aegyptia]|uniref:Lipoprotein n=1 Tax=Nocardiopsis aegyptia TaxID=220378 RepID=A0A7Z0EJB1_9ACTN|nr:hypothetical protein [Nocardiopsis aegyptia]NYJ33155.1 hypothetical protein [Nocardiopsis aegyptia]